MKNIPLLNLFQVRKTTSSVNPTPIAGFARGFLTFSEHAEFLYKTTDYWLAAAERSIRWDDQALGL